MPQDNLESNPLKEYLKIIKDYHRLLLLLSATVLLFALSPDEAKSYSNGLAELKNFMTYGESKKIIGYLSYLDCVAGERAEKLRIMDALKDVVGEKSISGVIYLNEDAIAHDKKGIKLLADLQGMDEVKLEQMTAGTIASIGQKMSNYNNFYLFEPDISKLKESLIKKGFRDTIAKGYILVDFRLDNTENGVEDQTSSFGLLINGLSRYTAEFKSLSNGSGIYVKGGMRGNLVKQKVLTVAEWIEKTDTGKGSNKFVKNGVIFPAMRQIWGEVMSKTPQEAYFAMEGKWEEKKVNEKITVLGLSFPQNLILTGCPLIMFLFLLYYRSHLLIVLNRLQLTSSGENGMVFPWIGLYDGIINKLLTMFSSWLLPFISIVALFIRLWAPREFSFWIAILLGIGVLSISPNIYKITRKIKKLYTN